MGLNTGMKSATVYEVSQHMLLVGVLSSCPWVCRYVGEYVPSGGCPYAWGEVVVT